MNRSVAIPYLPSQRHEIIQGGGGRGPRGSGRGQGDVRRDIQDPNKKEAGLERRENAQGMGAAAGEGRR